MSESIINRTVVEKGQDLVLQYLIREPKLKAGKQKAIILLHGVGSNEQDLFRLSEQLPEDIYIIAPRGPYNLGTGRYAWYNVDFSSGTPAINPAEENSSRDLIRTFIRQVKEKYQLDEVYLGGFSQGAIMSYSIGLIYPGEVQAIMALSGRILDEIKPSIAENIPLPHLKVLVTHGLQDATLPLHYGRAAKEYLEKLGVQLTYREYPAGHQITSEMLKDINSWL